MNSEELRKQSQRIIDEARTKTTQEEEAEADKITDKIPGLIRDAITKKLKAATVMFLTEAPKPSRLIPYPKGHLAKKILRNRHPVTPFPNIFEDFFSEMPPITTEYELTGVAKIVFNRCTDAGLNPFVAQTEDKTKWSIGIRWE